MEKRAGRMTHITVNGVRCDVLESTISQSVLARNRDGAPVDFSPLELLFTARTEDDLACDLVLSGFQHDIAVEAGEWRGTTSGVAVCADGGIVKFICKPVTWL